MPQQQGSSMSEKKSSQRFHSLNSEQVEVLHQVLSEVVPIHGRGNFPTLELRPRDIIIAVRARLQKQGITVRDVRLNGSTASHVLVRDNGTSYKDLDIIFGVELPSQEEFQVIKDSVLGCLLDCLPVGVNRERISCATMKEAYVQKMVKVFNEHDRWSLISLLNNSGKNLELKFVSTLRRQFEFSVDSFQIILDPILESYMQQDSQHKMNLKDQPRDSQKKDSSFALSHATAPETEKPTGRDSPSGEKVQVSRTQQRDEVHEKESQTEFSQEAEHSSQAKNTTEKNENTSAGMEEVSENKGNLNETNQISLHLSSEKEETSGEAETPAQTEHRRNPELLDETEPSMKVDQADQVKPCDSQQPSHLNDEELSVQEELTSQAKLPGEQREVTGQMGHSDTSNTSKTAQAECLILAEEQPDKTNLSESFREDQRSNEADKTPLVSAPDSSTSSSTKTETQSEDERKTETESSEDVEAKRENVTEMSEITEEISALEEKHVVDTQSIDCSCSTSSTLTSGNTHSTDKENTQEIQTTQHSDNSEKSANSLDAISPTDTQDILPAPPGLVSDKKTSSSPSGKVSERLSHMVVLKHSSPKPPRRMCRKIAPNPNPYPVSESELLPAPCLDSNPCLKPESNIAFSPNPTHPSPDPKTIPATAISDRTNSFLDPNPSIKLSSIPDPTSAPDPTPDIISTSARDPTPALSLEPTLSQEIIEGSRENIPKETLDTDVAFDEPSQSSTREMISELKQSEPLGDEKTPVSHTDVKSANGQEPVNRADEGDIITEDQINNINLNHPNIGPQDNAPSSPTSSLCVTPPVFNLSPPCFTSSPTSPSPPPCLTPPSPMLSTVSPATSFSSPPLSFSPTSSSLSSPPYLTPPMLNLSPPPLCLTPPSPCLSPPLLSLTPPVESEEHVPQLTADMESLILNTDSNEEDKQPSPPSGVPQLELEDKKEHKYISSLPQVAKPVSFPITIPSSTSHVLSQCPSADLGESAPPKATEASNSVPEKADVPKVTTYMSGQCNTPQPLDSVPTVEVLAESMYGDFEAAMDHLRYRLIATRNPEEIRGGGLLKYSNLLVRDYRPASETQIKTLERYMCSRFFIDFPDVQEQQRKILSYLKNHFIGEERSKYQYLMTLRRVIDDSTVCLMGHERRQTLNMITVLALKVLGEQNIIPNTDHVTCFYQPAPYLAEHSAPYLAEPSYCSYYIPQGGSTLLYQPYPLHLHPQTGLV